MPSEKVKALIKGVKWVLIIILVSMAFLSIALRVALPKIETSQAPLKQWMKNASNFEVEYTSLKSELHFFTPSIKLQNVVVKTPEYGEVLKAKNIELQIDLLSSLFYVEPIISHFVLDGLVLDLTQISQEKQSPNITLSEQLERFFLVDLHNFSIRESSVSFLSVNDEVETIDIEYLKGKNDLSHHKIQGVVSLQGAALNQMEVNADFIERGGLSTLSGNFYFNAQDISIIKWINPFFNSDINLTQADLNGEVWINIEEGVPQSIAMKSRDLLLGWGGVNDKKQNHLVSIEKGNIQLWRDEGNAWHLVTENLAIKEGNRKWSNLALKMDFSEDNWQFNLAEIDLQLLMSIRELIILPKSFENALVQLKPKGQLYNLRIKKAKDKPISYSGYLNNFAFEQWSYLPKARNISVKLVGMGDLGKAILKLNNTALPYQGVFQAPLEIEKADISLFWRNTEQGFRIWSKNAAVSSSYLGVNANFLLDIPHDKSPWLSLYAEASLSDAGQTWRYLPLPALSSALTNFLTRSIGAGEVKTAQILWEGSFDDFPYQKHQGVFQAFVPLKKADFRFDTQWPSITELDLDLFFENDALYLEASDMNMLGARGQNLKGSLDFDTNGPLKIEAKIDATGEQLHRYMLASPLVDSVGAALTHINIEGKVQGDLSLVIPFDDKAVDAKGLIRLANNRISITTPAVQLDKVKGNIAFKNDKVWTKSLSGNVFEQPVDLEFQGETAGKKYAVNIGAKGNWGIEKLKKQLKPTVSLPFTGKAPWNLAVGIALGDVDFDYNVKLDAKLAEVQSNLPAPFDNALFSKGRLSLKASGNKQEFTGQLTLPNLKYQAQVDISTVNPKVKKSRLVIGEGELSLHPLLSNIVSINLAELDGVKWMPIIEEYKKQFATTSSNSLSFFPISRLSARIDKLRTPYSNFNDFSLTIRRKKENFHFVIDSQELTGDALWHTKHRHINMNLDQLFIHTLPNQFKENSIVQEDRVLATKADKEWIKNIPSLALSINDLWIQGHRLGQLDMRLQKSRNKLSLTRFNLGNTDAKVNLKADWFIDKQGKNNTSLDFLFSGKNSSALMERFAFKEGIQDAEFLTKGKITYQSVPWAINAATLNGKSQTSLKNGFISGVGGASRILGLFSLDSIIRKIRLDFSGVFDDGLAFDKITGNVEIKEGIATTKDIEMKALAGDMYIKGTVDLNQNSIDANVRFVPDLTSGLPVLTAFAVAPHAAIYVLAVTTVLSPVIDAFTQIQYQVTGNIDKPIVKEISRRRNEIEVSKSITENLRSR